MQKTHGIKKHLTWCTMGIVKQVQQLDNHTEITPVNSIKASYYTEEEICMFALMVERVEDVFLSIFVRAVKHTKLKHFFSREISMPSPQIHRKCFNSCLLDFLFSIDL
jgi:hypothetical protein